MGELLVGAGKANIDPSEDMFPMTTHFGICEAIHDSCYCRALAIDNGDTHVLLVVFELSDMPEIPDLWGKIAQEVGYDKDEIILTVTHNHGSPNDSKIGANAEEKALGERYKAIELSGAVQACKQAVASMRPARYAYEECESFINVNRDTCTRNGEWVGSPNYKNYSDKTLSLLKFIDLNGEMIAVVMNHATHAVCTYQQRDTDGMRKLSADFPGMTCQFLEEYYGNGMIAIWTSGAAGNQNPILSSNMVMLEPDGDSHKVKYPDGVGYIQMEYIGRRHAEDALEGLLRESAYKDQMDIHHLKREIEIPGQKKRENSVISPGGWPEMEEDPDHPVPLFLELLVLGDVAVICVGAELYAQLGKRLKEISPYKNTIILTHTHYHIGYILDKSSAQIKIQQSCGRIMPGGADDLIIDCVKEMLKEAKAD